jgi:hypothetical protein
VIDILIPMRLPSAANLREHWAVKAKRVKAQRVAVRMYLGGTPRPAFPVVVTLTRIAPRALDDDNLRSAWKGPRDQVATFLGVPDNHPGIRWDYAQERRGPKVYAIRIQVT